MSVRKKATYTKYGKKKAQYGSNMQQGAKKLKKGGKAKKKNIRNGRA